MVPATPPLASANKVLAKMVPSGFQAPRLPPVPTAVQPVRTPEVIVPPDSVTVGLSKPSLTRTVGGVWADKGKDGRSAAAAKRACRARAMKEERFFIKREE